MYSTDRYVTALHFAADRHRDQRLPGHDLPYLVHLVSVAAEVIAVLPAADLRDADLAVACALLHDVVEDTETRLDEVAARFGPAVAAGVAALTKDPTLPKAEQMADSLRRIRSQPVEIAAVKLADRTTNLAPPPAHWSPEKCRLYLEEAHMIGAALGDRCPPLHARLRARGEAYAAWCGAPAR